MMEGMTSTDRVTPQQIRDAGLDWTINDKTITATFSTGDFATGLALINLIGESAETHNHHPDIELTYPTVTVTLTSHDIDDLSERDLRLARLINDHAEQLGVKKTS